MHRFAVVLFITACNSDDPTCGHTSDGSYPDEGVCQVVAVHSSVDFDHVQIFLANQAVLGSAVPMTPQLLAGTTVPSQYDVFSMADGWYGELDLHKAVGDYDVQQWTLRADVRALGVVASAQQQFVGAGETSELTDSTQSDGGWRRDGSIELLDVPNAVEIWGSAGADRCVRLATPTGTHFIVRDHDRDCDGIPDATDCKPLEYCDPAVAPCC